MNAEVLAEKDLLDFIIWQTPMIQCSAKRKGIFKMFKKGVAYRRKGE